MKAAKKKVPRRKTAGRAGTARRAKRVEPTLADVGRRALSDPEFWARLRVDPDATLRAARIPLGAEDRERLARALQGNQLERADTLFAAVHRAVVWTPRREGGWVSMWRFDWP